MKINKKETLYSVCIEIDLGLVSGSFILSKNHNIFGGVLFIMYKYLFVLIFSHKTFFLTNFLWY